MPLPSKPIVWPTLPHDVLPFDETFADEWRVIVADYESDPDDLMAAWLYIGHHPAFWALTGPDSRSGYRQITFATAWERQIEFGVSKTGDVCFLWLEASPVLWDGDPGDEEYFQAAPGMPSRSVEYDTATYENLVLVTAQTMHSRYGNDREFIKLPELSDKWFG